METFATLAQFHAATERPAEARTRRRAKDEPNLPQIYEADGARPTKGHSAAGVCERSSLFDQLLRPLHVRQSQRECRSEMLAKIEKSPIRQRSSTELVWSHLLLGEVRRKSVASRMPSRRSNRAFRLERDSVRNARRWPRTYIAVDAATRRRSAQRHWRWRRPTTAAIRSRSST
jgi:hypothetical protein